MIAFRVLKIGTAQIILPMVESDSIYRRYFLTLDHLNVRSFFFCPELQSGSLTLMKIEQYIDFGEELL